MAWDTVAPADFTYVFHPRPGARATATTSRSSRASWRSSATGSSRASRAATTSSCSTASVVRYVLPERRDGQSVPEVLDLLEDDGLRPRGRLARPLGARVPGRRRRQPVPGDRAPGDRAHRAVAAAGAADREQGRRGQRRRRRHRLAPARRDRPPHAVARGRDGRRRAQRPRPAPVRRPRHLHRRCRAVRRSRDRGSTSRASPSAASVAAGSSSPTSSCSSRRRCGTTRRSSTSRPAAAPACDRPSIALRKFHRRHLRGARLRARRRRRQRLLGGARSGRPPSTGASASARSTATGGSRTSPTSGSPPTSTRWGATCQRVPRRHLRVPRDARQGRHPGVQHRHGAVERHVVRRAGRGRR